MGFLRSSWDPSVFVTCFFFDGFPGCKLRTHEGLGFFLLRIIEFQGFSPMEFRGNDSWESKGRAHPPLCHVETPQEIASLIKGLLTTIVP